jgi:hypothetical protein
LAKGAVGDKPAFLMASLLLARALAAAMARERNREDRHPFHIIIDEERNVPPNILSTLYTDPRKSNGPGSRYQSLDATRQ